MFLVFCSVQMTQTLTHFIPFSSSNFFLFLLIFIKKNCTHTLRKNVPVNSALFSLCQTMLGEMKSDIYDASLRVMPFFEAKRRKQERTLSQQKGRWKGSSKDVSNVTFKKPFEKLFEKAVVQKTAVQKGQLSKKFYLK